MRFALCLAVAGFGLVALPAVVTAADEPAAKQSRSKDDPNRLICRRMDDTGSLARSRRTCMTRADWDKLAERTRRDSMAGQMTGGTSGN